MISFYFLILSQCAWEEMKMSQAKSRTKIEKDFMEGMVDSKFEPFPYAIT